MSLGRLVWRQLWSHPVRSLLTVLAISVAMFLFCFLQSILTSLDAAVTASASNRIITQSAVSLFQVLPRSYRGTLESIDGVESVGPFTWFGGLYKDSSGFFAQFGADPETLLRQYPEVMLPEDQVQAFLDDRRGCVIGVALAEKYGWGVGDSVPLLGTIYPKIDESEWTFEVKGIYRSAKANVDEQTLYFHHEYLEETLDRGECYGPIGTGVFIVRVADDARGEDVAQRIDAYFDGGPQRTRTQTEAAFQADFIKMLGNLPTFLGMIVGAVLVAILFGVVNTMTIAARERTRTVGILEIARVSRRGSVAALCLRECAPRGAGNRARHGTGAPDGGRDAASPRLSDPQLRRHVGHPRPGGTHRPGDRSHCRIRPRVAGEAPPPGGRLEAGGLTSCASAPDSRGPTRGGACSSGGRPRSSAPWGSP